MKRVHLATAVLLAIARITAAPARAQAPPERITVLVADGPVGKVTGAEFHGTTLFVLAAEPAGIYRAEGTRLRRWGATTTLQSPADVAVAGERLLVRDAGRQSLATFGADGRLLATRPLPGPIASWVGMSGGDTLVTLLAFRNDSAALVRLRGAAADTLRRFAMPHPVRLMARGSPTYSVAPPFSPTPAWAALPGGGVAFWDGGSGAIARLDARGRPRGSVPLPRERYPVGAADREWWLNDAIPQEFMGRRVFEPLRARARTELSFPSTFPVVLALLADPAGGVWIRRTPPPGGEVWAWVDEDGTRARLRLPPGRELIAIGPAALAARSRDAAGRPVVELYRKPAPGRSGAPRSRP